MIIPSVDEHCVYWVDLESPSAPREVYAGRVNNRGSKYNDKRDEMKLDTPYGVVVSSTDVIISLKARKELIAIDKKTDKGSKLTSTELHPRFLLLSIDEQTLYVTMKHALGKLELSSSGEDVEMIAGSSSLGTEAGELWNTEFSIPGDIALLDDTTVLVADQENNRYYKYTAYEFYLVQFFHKLLSS